MENSNGQTKVNLTLVGLDGNAYALMGTFSVAAHRQGFAHDDVQKILDKCMSGDYDHLLRTLMEHTEEEEEI